ncbi:contactin-2-like [Hydractinia symbiolongicarpus]|uniref:contactin-2-like n=1 Tax=Hydractinia symbiolongicarpus TaxID=13093 RepID=UPI002550B5FD|nr:contactin-2-like [Hydractinia symbiolongicarpus]
MASFKTFMCAMRMLLFIHGSLSPLPVIKEISLEGNPPLEGFPGRNSLTLECKYSCKSNVTISWTFNGTKIHNKGQYSLIAPDKLRVLGVTNRNNGVYRCHVSNNYGAVFSEYILKVKSLGEFNPGFQSHDAARTVKATLGKSLTLKCPTHTTGHGQIYYWGVMKYNAVPVILSTNLPIKHAFIGKSGSFVIPHLKQSDVDFINNLGGISCILYNQREVTLSCQFKIDAQKATNESFLPTLVSHMDKEFSAVEGRSVDILCGATGKPTPLISWYKNGVKILPSNGSGSGNIKILAGNMQLRIDPVTATDFGVYKCVTRNSLGEDSKQGLLMVHSEPSWIKQLPKAQVVSHNFKLTLECSALGYPVVQYSLYHNDTLLTRYTFYKWTVSKISDYQLPNLMPWLLLFFCLFSA